MLFSIFLKLKIVLHKSQSGLAISGHRIGGPLAFFLPNSHGWSITPTTPASPTHRLDKPNLAPDILDSQRPAHHPLSRSSPLAALCINIELSFTLASL